MVEYIKVNVKLSYAQLNKLRSAVKNQTKVTLGMNIKMFNGDKWPHELILKTRLKTKLRNAFENSMTADIKLSKTHISTIIQPGSFLGTLLNKIAGPFMKVAVSLAKNILAQLGVTAAGEIDAEIQKKIHGFGTATLIVSNEEMNDIMKIVQTLEDSNILGITKTLLKQLKMKWKNKKEDF